MTATTHSIERKKSTTHSVNRKSGADAPAAALAFAGVQTVRGALDVCSELQRDDHVVTESSIGRASSVLAS